MEEILERKTRGPPSLGGPCGLLARSWRTGRRSAGPLAPLLRCERRSGASTPGYRSRSAVRGLSPAPLPSKARSAGALRTGAGAPLGRRAECLRQRQRVRGLGTGPRAQVGKSAGKGAPVVSAEKRHFPRYEIGTRCRGRSVEQR